MRATGVLASVLVPPKAFLPRVLPAGWRVVERSADGAAYMRADGLSVIVSVDHEQDGRRWLHVSCARATKLPSWSDLQNVKDLFVGHDRYAYQVLATKAKHVNINEHCLHIWSCLDADQGAVLPDFTRGGNSI